MPEKDISSLFITYFSQSSAAKDYFFKHAKQTVNLASINLRILSNFPIPIPSTAEQMEVVQEIEEKFSVCEHLESDISDNIEKAKALRQSILKLAFEGKLVPQNPEDESASVLIQRIQEERKAESKKDKQSSAQRREKVVRSRKPTRRMADLLKVLESESNWLAAQEAFGRCGIADNSQTDAVEKIYLELRQLVRDDRVEVERRGDEDYLRIMSERSV